MRIALFTDAYVPYISGVAVAVVNQSSALAKRGHQIKIFCPSYKNLGKGEGNIEVIGLPATFRSNVYKDFDMAIPTAVRSASVLRDFKPDCIHSATEGGVGWEGLICSKIFDVPMVSTIHTFLGDPLYLKNIKLEKSLIAQKMIWGYSILFHNRCDTVICPSKVMRREARKRGLKKPVRLLSNGIDLSAYKKGFCWNEKLARGSFNMIYVGRISIEKSIDILIKAMRIVTMDHPKVRLFLVGDGPAVSELKKEARKYKLQDNIVFMGKIRHDMLISTQLLKGFDAFVTASKTENQPISVMEAMAAGLPILGVDMLGVPELAIHGRNGLIAEPDDYVQFAHNIIHMIKNPDVRKQMSEESLRIISGHSLDTVASELEGMYAKLIQRHRKRSQMISLKIEQRFTELKERYGKIVGHV